MSDPTYRIDIRPDPHGAGLGWHFADITRLSDDAFLISLLGESAGDARARAVRWIHEENNKPLVNETVYVDDDGRPVEGHSVKAP